MAVSSDGGREVIIGLDVGTSAAKAVAYGIGDPPVGPIGCMLGVPGLMGPEELTEAEVHRAHRGTRSQPTQGGHRPKTSHGRPTT